MEKECDKHPIEFMGMSPRDFTKEFCSTNYAYWKEFFKELNKEYLRQSEGDAERPSLKNESEKRVQLPRGLSELAKSCDTVAGFIDTKYGEYKESLRNLNPENLARGFGFTNYFYQREVFKIMKKEMPISFILISKSIDDVCNSCKNFMKNPYE